MIKIKFLGHGPIIDHSKKALLKHFRNCEDNPDIVVVANFGKIIPEKDLSKTPHLNIHGSILPALRGATPVQTAIKKGLKMTGYSIILMDSQVDHGPILKTRKIAINPNDTYGDVMDKIGRHCAKNLIAIIPDFLAGKIEPIPQNHLKATYTKKIVDADRLVTLDLITKDPIAAHNHIRALFPKPKAYLKLDHKRLIIHKAHIKNDRLILDIVQLEGRKPLGWREFLRGWRKKIPEV
jgi:methionyl-tRNA formyltransferase